MINGKTVKDVWTAEQEARAQYEKEFGQAEQLARQRLEAEIKAAMMKFSGVNLKKHRIKRKMKTAIIIATKAFFQREDERIKSIFQRSRYLGMDERSEIECTKCGARYQGFKDDCPNGYCPSNDEDKE